MNARRINQAQIAFGDAVRRARLAHGLSQEKLAALAGIHRNYVGDVERGEKNISLVSMLKIGAALRVPVSELMRQMEHDLR